MIGAGADPPPTRMIFVVVRVAARFLFLARARSFLSSKRTEDTREARGNAVRAQRAAASESSA
jgi:hypothetical protein